MLRSMTGYGYGEVSSEEYKFCVEIKTINHRFCEIFLRIPGLLSPLEEQIKKKIRGRVVRGRVDVNIKLENLAGKRYSVKVDKNLALAYYKAIRELKENLQIEDQIKIKHLISLPEVLGVQEVESDITSMQPGIEKAVETALDELVKMREREGRILAEDILGRMKRIAGFLQEVEKRAPRVLEDYCSRLNKKLREWVDAEIIGHDRISAEVALFAERSDITEEIVRLQSHLQQMEKYIADGGIVGRKLDFLVQEMYREVNTIGAKANDSNISALVVELKGEIEKIREQVQNIE